MFVRERFGATKKDGLNAVVLECRRRTDSVESIANDILHILDKA